MAAPGPTETPVATAAERLRPGRSLLQRQLAGLPLAVLGAVAVAAGTLVLALPTPSIRTVGVTVGIALLASAAVEIVEFGRQHDRLGRADRLIAVAALAGAGTVVLTWPTISQLALLYAVGASAVALGVAEAAALSTQPRSTRERWLGALSSIVAFVFGIAMLGRPGGSLAAVINLLGFYLIVLGALRLLQAVNAIAPTTKRARSVRPERDPPP